MQGDQLPRFDKAQDGAMTDHQQRGSHRTNTHTEPIDKTCRQKTVTAALAGAVSGVTRAIATWVLDRLAGHL